MQPAVRITLATTSTVPDYDVVPWYSGILQLTTGLDYSAASWPDQWRGDYIIQMDPVGERVDIAKGGNYAQMLDTSIYLSNHNSWFGLMESAGASIIGARVQCGDLDETTFAQVWEGTIADAYLEDAAVVLRVESILAKRHKTIPTRVLTAAEFPVLGSSSIGSVVPSVYGAVVGMTPPSLQSDNDYRYAFMFKDLSETVRGRNQTFAVFGSGIPLQTKTSLSIAMWSTQLMPMGSTDGFWLDDVERGDTEDYYIEFVSGTGSGQVRLIPSTYTKGMYTSPDGTTVGYITFSLSSPLGTEADATTAFKIYRSKNSGVLAIADECTVSRVYVNQSGSDYEVAFSQGTVSGVDTADVSAEFREGTQYSAIAYRRPDNVFGISALNDGYSKSFASTRQILGLTSSVPRDADAICRAVVSFERADLVDILDQNPKVYAVISAASSYTAGKIYLVAYATCWDGTNEEVVSLQQFPGASYSVNAYSPTFAIDGVGGNFAGFSVEITGFDRPLAAYRNVRIGVVSDGPVSSAANSYSNVSITYGSTVFDIPFVVGVDVLPTVGQFVRPNICVSPSTFDVQSGFNQRNFIEPLLTLRRFCDPSLWHEVQAVTMIAPNLYRITTTTPLLIDTGYYGVIFASSSAFVSADEYECGIALVTGTVDVSSDFRVDLTSGRESSGTPITLARDAAVDMMSRDLGLTTGEYDAASFSALPADSIRSALVKQTNSAEWLASLCEQYNWVVSHSESGKETAFAWLSRVGTTEYDVQIDTGDMVEGSIKGRDLTDVADLVNLPTISWDWTQADGYRQSATVTDIAADPSTLTSENYTATIAGFGDFAASAEVYGLLHKSYQLNDYKQSATIEYKDAGADITTLLFPDWGMSRIAWMASRKQVLTFDVPETSVAASVIVGQRVKVRHKRFTRNVWLYGTCVEWAWSPMGTDAYRSIKVMLDPSLTSDTTPLYEDTIDPGATVDTYADTLDAGGTAPIYEDTLGV